MSLDVYVTPMWRFKAGNVETAAQRLCGDQTRVVIPDGMFSPARIKGYFAQRRAKREVRRIISEAEKKLKARLKWLDEGDTIYSQQASWGFEALRAFAKWLDLRDYFPSFDDPPDGNFYEHPAMRWDEDPSRSFRFSHIIDHSCHNGYFVPCQFGRVIFVEPFQTFGQFTFYHSFGSSYTLAEQLQRLEPYIPMDNTSCITTTARDLIRAGFDTLKTLSEKSVEHKLPIIFWG